MKTKDSPPRRKGAKPFAKMTAAQKRVAIAKDVLKQIEAKRFQMKSGRWVCQRSQRTFLDQARVNQRDFECRVCGIGAAVVSGLGLFNGFVIQEFEVSLQTSARWFSISQARLIELAFEIGTGVCRPLDPREEEAVKFADDLDSEQRAIAIYKNIIANGGTFKPGRTHPKGRGAQLSERGEVTL